MGGRIQIKATMNTIHDDGAVERSSSFAQMAVPWFSPSLEQCRLFITIASIKLNTSLNLQSLVGAATLLPIVCLGLARTVYIHCI